MIQYDQTTKNIYISRKNKHWLFNISSLNRKCQYTAVSRWMNGRLKINKADINMPHHRFWHIFIYRHLTIPDSGFWSVGGKVFVYQCHIDLVNKTYLLNYETEISHRIILDDKNSKSCVDSTQEWRWKRADQGKLEDFLTNVCSCTS